MDELAKASSDFFMAWWMSDEENASPISPKLIEVDVYTGTDEQDEAIDHALDEYKERKLEEHLAKEDLKRLQAAAPPILSQSAWEHTTRADPRRGWHDYFKVIIYLAPLTAEEARREELRLEAEDGGRCQQRPTTLVKANALSYIPAALSTEQAMAEFDNAVVYSKLCDSGD